MPMTLASSPAGGRHFGIACSLVGMGVQGIILPGDGSSGGEVQQSPRKPG